MAASNPASPVPHRATQRLRVVAAVLLLVLVAVVTAPPAPAELIGAVTPVHDPTVVRDGDTWWAFSTGRHLPVLRSDDLRRWERAGEVFPDGIPDWLASAIPTDQDVWAPDISWFGERWHLYYAKAVFGTTDAVIGLATNASLDPADPDYEWVDEGPIVRSLPGDGIVAIDPNVVIDEAGQPWMAWGSFWDGIAIQRLDPEDGHLIADAPRTILAARDPWWLGVEGVSIVHRDGWWWLSASFGFCCRGVDSRYSVHIGRSRSLTGPYLDQAGVPMTRNGGTLLIGSHGDQIGIGHGTLFDAGDGDWSLVHHYYDASNGGTPTLGITPIVELDGWPIGVDPSFTAAAAPGAAAPGTWHLTGYDEDLPAHTPDDVTLALRADGTVVDGGTWLVDGEVLEVRDVPVAGPDGQTTRRTWRLLLDGDLAIGRDDRTATVRADRVGPAPEVPTTTSSTTTSSTTTPSTTTPTTTAPATATEPPADPMLAAVPLRTTAAPAAVVAVPRFAG